VGRVNEGENPIIFLFLAEDNEYNCFVFLKCKKAVQNFERIGSNKEVFMTFFSMAEHPAVGQDQTDVEALR
jgi:hypothetical protein